MIFKGECRTVFDNQIVITTEDEEVVEYFKNHMEKPLKVEVKRWRNNRTLAQNALYWACIYDLAKAIRTDRDSLHLLMLKQLQKPVTYAIQKDRMNAWQEIWKTHEIVDEETDEEGNEICIVNCYFGTEYMDTEEFGYLLDMVITQMKEVGIEPPSKEMKNYLDALGD